MPTNSPQNTKKQHVDDIERNISWLLLWHYLKVLKYNKDKI